MCNDIDWKWRPRRSSRISLTSRSRSASPKGRPNIQARQDIKITDMAPIVRTIDGEPNAGDLVQRRWSWPGPNGKPVYNFRSNGREFTSGRCLIIADGFYEFTDPADKKKNFTQHRPDCTRIAVVAIRGHPVRDNIGEVLADWKNAFAAAMSRCSLNITSTRAPLRSMARYR
jgi:putative SOS response-associated peptidase YedK